MAGASTRSIKLNERWPLPGGVRRLQFPAPPPYRSKERNPPPDQPAGGRARVADRVRDELAHEQAHVVERVESVSREGVSLVTLRFAWGTDMDFAALSVREQLDNLSDALPELADRPAVLRTDPTAEPIMSVSVAGRELWALRDVAEAVFKRRLEQIDGIAQAAVTGGLEREIQVDVDARALESHGLSITQVADALAAANVSAPGGTIRRGRYRYSLRTLGEIEVALKDLGFAGASGRQIVLTGGGAELKNIADYAQGVLGRTVRIGRPSMAGLPEAHSGPAFSTLAGLAQFAASDELDLRVRFTMPGDEERPSGSLLQRLIATFRTQY